MSSAEQAPPLTRSTGDTAKRRRLVIDPIWKTIDADAFTRTWDLLLREGQLYGFVGFDMEWTTKMVLQDGEEGGEGRSDAASRPSKRKPRRWTGPVATIQLSTFSCTVVVRWSHLHALVSGNACDTLTDPYASISSSWPAYRVGQKTNPRTLLRSIYASVKELIANPAIFLVGVGIHGDEVKLHRDYPKVVAHSAVDLTMLADACLPELVVDRSRAASGGTLSRVRTDSLRSLKKLCAALTGKELGKDMSVVMSDWGGCHGALTPLQIEYSAEDAEASYDACAAILIGGGFLRSASSAEDGGHECTAEGPWRVAEGVDCREVLSCCITTAGEEAADRRSPSAGWRAALDGAAEDAHRGSSGEPSEIKMEREWCKGRARPYYDNINVYSPDMQLVFTVDKAKAEWYVEKKGLATVVEWRTTRAALPSLEGGDDSSAGASTREMAAIRLTFTPDFARYNDAHIRRNLEYFKQPKENICVVCGEGGSLVRFAVVPLMYRRFFPSVYMSHNSYDLLLLCPRCFAQSRQLYEQLRLTVAEDFGIPLHHLRGAQRDDYARRVQQLRDSLDAESRAYESLQACEGADECGDAAAADCDLHPRRKLEGMADYLALMEHREVLDKVFSYAKALHAHYQSVLLCNSGEGEGGCGDGAEAALPGAPQLPLPAKLPKRRGGRARSACSANATTIPEGRRQMMAEFLSANAPLYPFYFDLDANGDDKVESLGQLSGAAAVRRESGAAMQADVFCAARDGGPASPQGVSFILNGCVEESPSPPAAQRFNTSRGVLSRFWVREHPEVLASLPAVTRVEERQREQTEKGLTEEELAGDAERRCTAAANAQPEDDSAGLPYVDSHAFVVVQQLLKKYNDGSGHRKTGEHAVGQFIYRWRSSFVEGMKPQHLPHGWTPEDGILR